MSGRVSLSRKDAQELYDILDGLEPPPPYVGAMKRLGDALAPRKPRPLAVASRKVKAEKKATKKERRADVREAVLARAVANGGFCECGCGISLSMYGFHSNPEMDHFYGRARAESVETCWALRRDCHFAKGLNSPTAEVWLQKFIAHCEKHGYHAEAERARARLEGICAIRRAEAER